MSLARRLAAAVLALAVALVLSGGVVLLVQRSYLLGQVDEELTALTTTPKALVALTERVSAGGANAGVLADVYVGRLTRAGTLVTLLEPTNDPTLVPALTPGESVPRPATRPTASGTSPRVRVVTVQLPSGVEVVVAKSTAQADAAVRRLAATLALAALAIVLVVGLAIWWVYRLGLRPIAEMTLAADRIAAGDVDVRVPPGEPGTETARLGHAMNTMVEVTQQTQGRMRRFVADASHELRTPLTTLQGYSSLYLSGASTEPAEVADAMRRINAEATRMSRIVTDLLQLTDLDAHGVTALEPVDLVPLLADHVADLRVVQPERTVTLAAPERLVVLGDRDRLTQVVVALTSNALRHTPVSAALTIRAVAAGGVGRVEVRDTGPGVPPEHLPHLFDRFYRADRGRARASGGNGLGLAIVASIVSGHGGRYGVESAPGVGSTFWFEIPAAGP